MSLLDELPIPPSIEHQEVVTDGVFSSIADLARNVQVTATRTINGTEAIDKFYDNYAQRFANHVKKVQMDLNNRDLMQSFKEAVSVTHSKDSAISGAKLKDLTVAITKMSEALETFLHENKPKNGRRRGDSASKKKP
jgi:ribosome-associated translation inhibitor RaiA